MRMASLLAVFVLAKAAMLAGHHVPLSWWSPVAYFWQDAAAVLIFAGLEFCLGKRQPAAWVVYAVAALYSAMNIPVARALATPLTWPMWRAAGAALSDSMWHYCTWQNTALFTGTLAVALAGPRFFRRTPKLPLAAALALWAALGPTAAARVDTGGLERNAWTALIATTFAPGIAANGQAGWRTEGFARPAHQDLGRFRASAAGRNVVLVSLESTAAQYLGLYGASPDAMPNLSELARSAVVFENAYAVYPESIKGLFTILCSRYPGRESGPCRALPALLAEAGYRTALFHSGRFGYLGMEAVISKRGYQTMADAGDIGGNHNSSFGVDEPSTVARILQWIDGTPAGQPFFLTYLPIAGHHPYETPEPGPFAERDEFGRYRNALHYGDESLGKLMRGLDARGLARKTLWIVLGDHGEAFGQHEGNYGHTFQLYEENVHVPFLIAAPGLLARPMRSAQVVSLIDTAPTVLDWLGLAVPEDHQGRSVLEDGPRMALFFADYSRAIVGLRDGSRKYIYEMDSGRSRLFDLGLDPRERTNLADGFPEQTAWYQRNLRRWSARR